MGSLRKVKNGLTFFKSDSNVLRVEGGLGSQIFGIAKYHCLIEKSENEIGLDFSYFTSPRKSQNHPGLSFWQWALDSYGYSLQELIEANQAAWHQKKNKTTTRVADSEVWSWLKLNRKAFPMQLESRNEALNKLEINGEFNAIHIRRGDYTKISALITEHEQYLSLISKIDKLLAPPTIVFSDDEVEKSTREKYTALLGEQTYFLSSKHFSDRTSHDLMRSAKNLITANSTFSLSAAMLNDSAIRIFSPISFTAQDASSNGFLSLGDWYLHS
jgi:hypothetical protein